MLIFSSDMIPWLTALVVPVSMLLYWRHRLRVRTKHWLEETSSRRTPIQF